LSRRVSLLSVIMISTYPLRPDLENRWRYLAIKVIKIYLTFLTLSSIVSSPIKIPFPLYGSGILHALIFAAN